MNRSILRFNILFAAGVLLLGACQSQTPALVPITGSNNKVSLPAQVSLARQNVLEYVLASRLTSIPLNADWELQEIRDENEYHFLSGNWRMVIWAAGNDDQNQRVAIVNRAEGLSWTGYIAPDGHVVDTAYER